MRRRSFVVEHDVAAVGREIPDVRHVQRVPDLVRGDQSLQALHLDRGESAKERSVRAAVAPLKRVVLHRIVSGIRNGVAKRRRRGDRFPTFTFSAEACAASLSLSRGQNSGMFVVPGPNSSAFYRVKDAKAFDAGTDSALRFRLITPVSSAQGAGPPTGGLCFFRDRRSRHEACRRRGRAPRGPNRWEGRGNLLNPHKRPSFELRNCASFVKPVRPWALQQSLLPPVLRDSAGEIHKPAGW
jgi:hypothetical protein